MIKSQQGMALLVVLLLLAVMVTLAAGMTSRYRLLWQKTQNQQIYIQQHWDLKGAESFVSRILNQDSTDSPNKTSLDEYWASSGRIFPVEGSSLSGFIHDEQTCFNLNSLSQNRTIDPRSSTNYNHNVFKKLLVSLSLDTPQAEEITVAIEHWLDSQTHSSEDELYGRINPPYLPANHLMQDVSELRIVIGIDRLIYLKLLPYVCVLPTTSLQININTLSPSHAKLLSALFLGSINEASASSMLSSRPKSGWNSIAEFFNQNSLPLIPIIGDSIVHSLSVKSDYFSSYLSVQTDNQTTMLISLFYRKNNNKFVVIQRHFGDAW